MATAKITRSNVEVTLVLSEVEARALARYLGSRTAGYPSDTTGVHRALRAIFPFHSD